MSDQQSTPTESGNLLSPLPPSLASGDPKLDADIFYLFSNLANSLGVNMDTIFSFISQLEDMPEWDDDRGDAEEAQMEEEETVKEG